MLPIFQACVEVVDLELKPVDRAPLPQHHFVERGKVALHVKQEHFQIGETLVGWVRIHGRVVTGRLLERHRLPGMLTIA
jgi:hypothetical protein